MSQPVHAPSAEDLRRFGLFGAVSESALAFLSEKLRVLQTSPGTVIFTEGENGHEFYIVMDGEMEVVKQGTVGPGTRVAVLGPGDWFGEMSVVDVQPRSATVRTLSPATLLVITAADLDALYRNDLKSYCIVVLNIARGLSRRLRVADGLLAEMVASVVHRVAPPAG